MNLAFRFFWEQIKYYSMTWSQQNILRIILNSFQNYYNIGDLWYKKCHSKISVNDDIADYDLFFFYL